MADFEKVGLFTTRAGRVLMCRKAYFTSRLILPGGRVEPEETALECLERELGEELGNVLMVSPKWIGTYEDLAHADDPNVRKTLRIQLYSAELRGEPRPCSEIVELVWIGPDTPLEELTPIFVNRILPDLRARRLIDW